jgi:HYR domain
MRRVLILIVLVVAATVAAPAASEPQAAAGTLALNGVLQVEARRFVACPPNTGSTIECVRRNGQGKVPGLGEVSMAPYMYFIDLVPDGCPSGETRVLTSSMALVVAGKGEIDVTTAPTGCLQGSEGRPNTVQSFSITGGTGMYAGATGGGKVSRALTVTDVGAVGPETWTGTLVVPGLEFDVTAPTLAGARSKTVRVPKGAKKARVTFNVTATDDVDGAVSVSCQPRSGSRFKVGRTTVRCLATDSSGNPAKAAFAVTVRPRR